MSQSPLLIPLTSDSTTEKPNSAGCTPGSFSKNEKIRAEPRESLTEVSYIKIVNKAIREGLREENYQTRERKRRAKNVIIHGMREETDTDTELVANLFHTLEVCDSPASITRLGNATLNSTRPIKIVMPNVKKKEDLIPST